MKQHNTPTPEEMKEMRRITERVSAALHGDGNKIIEFGWFYQTKSGTRVEHVATDQVEDEDEIRKAIAANLLLELGDYKRRIID